MGGGEATDRPSSTVGAVFDRRASGGESGMRGGGSVLCRPCRASDLWWGLRVAVERSALRADRAEQWKRGVFQIATHSECLYQTISPRRETRGNCTWMGCVFSRHRRNREVSAGSPRPASRSHRSRCQLQRIASRIQ